MANERRRREIIQQSTKLLGAEIEKELAKKGITLRVLNLGVDTGTPTGRLIHNTLIGIAQFEREMMLERQREGIAKARREGKYMGRKPTARRAIGLRAGNRPLSPAQHSRARPEHHGPGFFLPLRKNVRRNVISAS